MNNIIDNIQEHVIPNLWGALVMAVAWVAKMVKDRKKTKIENEGGYLENAKRVIEMGESLINRIDSQNDKLTIQLDNERKALEDMTDERNDCKDQLRIVTTIKIDLERSLQLRNKEVESFKEQCRNWRKMINYQDENINIDYCNHEPQQLQNVQEDRDSKTVLRDRV